VALDYQTALFHVGVRVPDLEAAMEEIGGGLGITWARVVEREQRVWTPDAGPHTTPLRFTYSCEGPQHVELLQGAPGSVWDGADVPGVHHQGVWVDDVAAETERLVEAGWTLELAQLPPDEGYGSMTYVRSPSGFLLEPVTSRARPRFERWWAGEALD
jgi:lactoylglutathione lyase